MAYVTPDQGEAVPQPEQDDRQDDGRDERPYEGLSVEVTTTTGRVTEALRAALLDGTIAPGAPLREVALATQLRVARSTVREALGQLVAEGLATRSPHRGVTVTALDADAVRDVSRARAVLELAGARAWPEATQAARRAVRDAADALSAAARRGGDPIGFTIAHLALHRSFAALSGSRRLVVVAESLEAELRLALASVDRRRRNAKQQVSEHAALVALFEQGRVDEGVDALRAHLASAEASLLDSLGSPGGQ